MSVSQSSAWSWFDTHTSNYSVHMHECGSVCQEVWLSLCTIEIKRLASPLNVACLRNVSYFWSQWGWCLSSPLLFPPWLLCPWLLGAWAVSPVAQVTVSLIQQPKRSLHPHQSLPSYTNPTLTHRAKEIMAPKGVQGVWADEPFKLIETPGNTQPVSASCSSPPTCLACNLRNPIASHPFIIARANTYLFVGLC